MQHVTHAGIPICRQLGAIIDIQKGLSRSRLGKPYAEKEVMTSMPLRVLSKTSKFQIDSLPLNFLANDLLS